MTTTRFVEFPLALKVLREKHAASPEDIAAWVFYGPKHGGLEAFVNANEFDDPPRFHFQSHLVEEGQFDYVQPLSTAWFKNSDLDAFSLAVLGHYITGRELVDRWTKALGYDATGFIQAKISESRLSDFHPIWGGTQWSEKDTGLPPKEQALFALSEVERIEKDNDLCGKHQAGCAGQAEHATPKPLQRRAAQDAAILATLRELEHDPMKLPRPRPGMSSPPVKKAREALNYSVDVMQKAMRRLLKDGSAAYIDPPAA